MTSGAKPDPEPTTESHGRSPSGPSNPKDPQVLKIAIIGCGKIADGHVEQIRATGRGEVVAVCDREPLMAEQLAVRLGIPGQYTDAAQMLAECRPDVVHIATPPDSHRFLAELCFAAGCHVFMEKPFALTEAQSREIVVLAERAGKQVGVNYLYNYEPPGLELEQWVAGGKLGEIVHLDTSYGYNLAGDYGLAVMSDPNHWVHRLPGKLFHNVLDHVLAKVVPFLGDEIETRVLAFRRRGLTGSAIVDAMPDELRFVLRSGHVTVTGNVSAHGRPVQHQLRVIGTQESLELDYTARTLVRTARWAQPSALGRLFPAWVQAKQFAGNGWRNLGRFRRHEYHYFQCMRELLTRFYDAVEAKGPPPLPTAQILRVTRIIDQIVAGIAAQEAGQNAAPTEAHA
ncbi:putative dehydrogenase [Sphaerotilus mobilis]|uniref:Putative dehydrogenase n=1 Tax=Sphaerotilus mobilis TaxID=47994 RepID=A0A4Q7LFN1_9BURK|nr:putative dehydrogenase [Sphaerotilus mobilis]